MALHSSLAEAELHENKGVAGAADDTVATATSAATVWKKLTLDNLDIAGLDKGYVFASAGALTSADSRKFGVRVPFAGTLNTIYADLIIQNADYVDISGGSDSGIDVNFYRGIDFTEVSGSSGDLLGSASMFIQPTSTTITVSTDNIFTGTGDEFIYFILTQSDPTDPNQEPGTFNFVFEFTRDV